jgi:hypothetical protein
MNRVAKVFNLISPINLPDQMLMQDFFKYLQVTHKFGDPTIKKYFDDVKKVIKAGNGKR